MGPGIWGPHHLSTTLICAWPPPRAAAKTGGAMSLQLGISCRDGGLSPGPQTLRTALAGQLVQRACRARGPRRLHQSGSAAMILNSAFDAPSTPPPWSAYCVAWIGCGTTPVILLSAVPCMRACPSVVRCSCCTPHRPPHPHPQPSPTTQHVPGRPTPADWQTRPARGSEHRAWAKYSDTRHVWVRLVVAETLSFLPRSHTDDGNK
jgi:hypothetical protein